MWNFKSKPNIEYTCQTRCCNKIGDKANYLISDNKSGDRGTQRLATQFIARSPTLGGYVIDRKKLDYIKS